MFSTTSLLLALMSLVSLTFSMMTSPATVGHHLRFATSSSISDQDSPPDSVSDSDSLSDAVQDSTRDTREDVGAADASTDSTRDTDDPSGDELTWIKRALEDPEGDSGWDQNCRDEWNDGRVTTCEVREFPYTGRGAGPMAIDGGANGGMTVIGWDRDEVRVIYRVKARARTLEKAKELAKSITLERNGGWLRPRGPETNANQWWAVEVKAWVPRATDVALTTMNGPLGVRDVHGTMDLSAINGPVSLVRLGGAIVARVQNGPLHVELDGSRWDGKGLDAEAQNGPVDLEVPRNYSARMETGTINGPRMYEHTIELMNHGRGDVITMLGSGGPPVRVVTSNGPFHIAAAR